MRCVFDSSAVDVCPGQALCLYSRYRNVKFIGLRGSSAP